MGRQAEALGHPEPEGIKAFKGHDGIVWSVALLPGSALALSGGEDRTAKVWDMRSQSCIHTLRGHAGPVWSIAAMPSGRALSGSLDGTVKLWDVASETALTTKAQESRVLCVATSPAISAISGKLQCWRLPDFSPLVPFVGHEGDVKAGTASADGASLLSGSDDRTVRLWDLASGHEKEKWDEHTGPVTSVALTTDARFALSGSKDRTARVWRIGAGQSVKTFTGHQRAVEAVAVSPDGTLAASGDADGKIMIWPLLPA
jgi:WD40 repeat protein